MLSSSSEAVVSSLGLKTQADSGSILNEDDFRMAQTEARTHVKVPVDVVDLLVDLRTWLQEKCEPPVYLSDRRLVKAMGLLQVYCCFSSRSCGKEYFYFPCRCVEPGFLVCCSQSRLQHTQMAGIV